MLRPARFLGLLCLLIVSTVAACGYRSTLGGGGSGTLVDGQESSVPSRVMVVALRSDSPEPWLDRIVTDALRREVGGRSRLRLTNDFESAELQVRGRIRPLDTTSRSFSSFVAALEYSLTLALDLEVRLESGDVIRLDPTMLSETESYLASPDVEVTRTNRLEALRRLSDQIASRVADTIEMIDRPMPAGDASEGG